MKLALIAHDGKKSDMVAFVMKRLDFFNREDVSIVTTGTTGKKILQNPFLQDLWVEMLRLEQWLLVVRLMVYSSFVTL